ncbi:MAG: urate hydroxylase PuuD [Pararhizobium sp.]
MNELAIAWEWLAFAVRWLHVITAIAWIGSSFYFIALDLGLVQRPGMPVGASGEEWQVHGGGFYHIQKYMVAPAAMPEHLTWFKWESYATWLSGFTLLCLVYYSHAHLFLIDPAVLDVSTPVAILISIASIALGWIVYDLLCKSPIGRSTTGLMLVLYVMLVLMAWGYTELFTGRAAFLHLGAFTATIMTANVFVIIIPNQKIVVADLKAGRKPNPKLGAQAKQRSLHNNYLTLPVIFLMLSNHEPLAFGTEYNWAIASLVFLMGVTIRHWFNTTHARKGRPTWTWLATVILFIVIVWLSTNPKVLSGAEEAKAAAANTKAYAAFIDDPHFKQAAQTVQTRCSMCHAREPVYTGIREAPKGIYLETDADIAQHADLIYVQAARSTAMPPANVTQITPQERQLLAAWYDSATEAQEAKQ